MPEDLQIVMNKSDILTKKDFVGSFERVINHVIKIQENQQKAISALEAKYSQIIAEMRKEHGTTLEELKSGVNELFVGDKISEIGNMTKSELKALRTQINALFKAKAGEIDRKVGSIKPIVGARGPAGSPDSPEEVKAKLKKAGLKVEDIEGLEDAIKANRKLGGGHTDSGVKYTLGRIVKKETPSGAINGSNTSYTVTTQIQAVLSFAINGQAITDDEYTIAKRLANEAINHWKTYDNTYWKELFTTVQAGDGG